MKTIKFRGVEFFSKKFVYGQTIRETDDGFDIWNGDDWTHCTDLAQLVSFDRDGNEIYEGDVLIDDDGGTHTALFCEAILTNEGFNHTIPLEFFKLKEDE